MNFLSLTWLSVHSPSPQISFLLLHRQGVSRFPNPPHTKEHGSQILRAPLVCSSDILPSKCPSIFSYLHTSILTYLHFQGTSGWFFRHTTIRGSKHSSTQVKCGSGSHPTMLLLKQCLKDHWITGSLHQKVNYIPLSKDPGKKRA